MEGSIKNHGPLNKDLAKTQMKRDTEAISLVLKWIDKNNLFDLDRDKQLLISLLALHTVNNIKYMHSENDMYT